MQSKRNEVLFFAFLCIPHHKTLIGFRAAAIQACNNKNMARVPAGTCQRISATPVPALGQSTPINRASSQFPYR
jgi:hypothetical protein